MLLFLWHPQAKHICIEAVTTRCDAMLLAAPPPAEVPQQHKQDTRLFATQTEILLASITGTGSIS
jgi:hypothetical protein